MGPPRRYGRAPGGRRAAAGRADRKTRSRTSVAPHGRAGGRGRDAASTRRSLRAGPRASARLVAADSASFVAADARPHVELRPLALEVRVPEDLAVGRRRRVHAVARACGGRPRARYVAPRGGAATRPRNRHPSAASRDPSPTAIARTAPRVPARAAPRARAVARRPAIARRLLSPRERPYQPRERAVSRQRAVTARSRRRTASGQTHSDAGPRGRRSSCTRSGAGSRGASPRCLCSQPCRATFWCHGAVHRSV